MIFPAAIDYSWARPAPLSIAMAGYTGAMRYLGIPSDGRAIGRGELDALHANGLGVGFVYETSANATMGGEPAGRRDALIANGLADSLSVPLNVPLVIVTIDFDATGAQLRGPIADYARGALSASSRPVRPYGKHDALEILCGELGLFPCGWQCAAWSGNGEGSGGMINGRRLSRFACLYQDVGYVLNNSSDHNSIHMDRTELLWHPDWSTSPTQTPKEWDEMASEDDIRRIAKEEAQLAARPQIWADADDGRCYQVFGFECAYIAQPSDLDWLVNGRGCIFAANVPHAQVLTLRNYDATQQTVTMSAEDRAAIASATSTAVVSDIVKRLAA